MEKEIEEEASGKKPRKRTVRQMEYCYEADLEGAARLGSSWDSDKTRNMISSDAACVLSYGSFLLQVASCQE